MTSFKLPFAKPKFSEEDLEWLMKEFKAVLKSGWLTSGKNVEAFEDEFAEYIGTTYSAAVNSCTAALHSILLALDIHAGDEVIVPADTFVATANAVLYTGAKPVFVDSDIETFNISIEGVKESINSRTKAIIPVHLAGNPCDMQALMEIAEDDKLKLVEDCAHAHGACYQGRKCGTFGTASAFSFYATKIMTSGEGGMVMTDDKALAEKVKRLRNQGRGGYGPLEITELGYNYRMPDMLAAIGLVQLKHIEDFLAERQKLAEDYTNFLSKFGWMKPQLVSKGNLSSYYAYVVNLTREAPVKRDALLGQLKEKGVGASVLYHPVHTQPYLAGQLPGEVRCPVAEELGRRSLALPFYNGITKQEIEYLKDQIDEILSTFELPREGSR